jgi:hypothetical protein
MVRGLFFSRITFSNFNVMPASAGLASPQAHGRRPMAAATKIVDSEPAHD